MELFFEILVKMIIGDFISDFLGKNTRYYFLKLIKRGKEIEYLSGKSEDGANNITNVFLNFFVGMIVLTLGVFIIILIVEML